MIDLPTFTPPSVRVGRPLKAVTGGKYKLGEFEVGECRFWYGVTQQDVSPYCYYQRRFGKKFKTHKDSRDNRDGVTVERVQ